MRVIGITGGIGTGKSTLLNYLQEHHGAYVVEADRLAHNLMQKGTPVYEAILHEFGSDILNEDKSIDRKRLGAIVFGDENRLEQLNAIVHPAVKKEICADILTKRKEGKVQIYVIEAALLIEDGYRTICDEIWYIYADKEVRIRRLLAGRGGTREKWEQIIDRQSSENYYLKNSDVVIHNNESSEIMFEKTDAILS